MTAKEYLRQLWCLDRKINIKMMELEKLKAERGIRQMPDNQDRVTGSGVPSDPVSDHAIRIMELEKRIDAQVDRYVNLKEKIIQQIEGMKDNTYKDILTCRYILMMNWDDVADTMHYAKPTCFKIHGKALQAFYYHYLKEDSKR